MKIAITRKDEGVKEIECDIWEVLGSGALAVYKRLGNVLIYACTDWLDVELIDE